MNRIPTLLAPVVQNVSRSSAGDNREVDRLPQLNTSAHHRLYYPTNFVSSYDYPLVVWLHSQGSSEYEIDSVMNALSDQNYLAVAPRANRRCKSKSRIFKWGENILDYAFAEDVVWECIESALDNLPVRSDRIFLAGFGHSGTIAQWIGWQSPDSVAGVVSLSGPMPSLVGSMTQWKSIKELPVLFAQRKGATICSDADLSYAMQMAHRSSLSYRFLQLRSEQDSFGEADELSTSMLAAANRFMMGIVTESEISLCPEVSRDHLVGPFGIN
jgi:phospholipase/carboxylesterase